MWIKSSTQLSANVAQVVTAAATNFLITGELAGLVDCGVMALNDQLLAEVEKHLAGTDLDFLFLTHTHFDHLGGLVALRQRYPRLAVVGGAQSTALLRNREYSLELYRENLSLSTAVQGASSVSEEEWLAAVRIDRTVGSGETIDLGEEVEVKLVATPGHSADSVAYFVKPDAALLCGEAIGSYYGRERMMACFCHDYRSYIESLDALSNLDVKVLGFPHSGALTGAIVGPYFNEARQQAETCFAEIKESLAQGELLEEVIAKILGNWKSQNISPEGPFVAAQERCVREMVHAVQGVCVF